ncbi:MAG: NAD(P)-binding domain-containing protein [Hymenobacteraceae bacterium]|nr:NAD(P)-binding domain-containing protein [Hymenobacteraceae bacterium]
MKIGILGTGTVGQTIGTRLLELGHEAMLGSRAANNEKAMAWVEKSGDFSRQGSFADAAAFGEIIFNCTKGDASLAALRMAGADNLRGKVLVDVSNPLDFSGGFPPTLSICNTDSLGEQIQHEFPAMHVVKTLNTMWCGLMVNPAMLAGGDHTVFVSGNDSGAKEQTKAVLRQFGWHDDRIFDLGDLSTCRGTEMLLPVWLRLYGVTQTGAFNFNIVR